MRRPRHRFATIAIAALCLACAAISCRAAVRVELVADPAAAMRGDWLTYTFTVENMSADALDDTTFYLPLPIGIDQWSAEYTIDGGPTNDYPPNGLLPLDPIPGFAQRTIAVRALVEHGAPGAFDATAQLLGATGVLATVTVSSNVLPSVDAGADLLSDLGASVLVDGASASDGAGGIALYAWNDGGVGGTFDDPGILRPTYTPPLFSGIIELALRVEDFDGGEASDSLRLRVNAVPEVTLGGDLVAVEGQEIDLAGVTNDADGWVIGFSWSDGGAGGTFRPSSGSENPTYRVPNLTGCGSARIELTLTVTDDWGAQAEDSLTVIIEDANDPPLVDAGADGLAGSGGFVELDGTAVDSDGAIVSTIWEQIEGPPVELVEADRLDARFDAPTVWQTVDLAFRLTVRDDCGAEATDDVSIRVTPGDAPGGEAVEVRSRMIVSIEAFDDRGFLLPPFSAPPWGATVSFRITVANAGEAPLSGVAAWGNGEAFPMAPTQLEPGERADGEADILFIPDASGRFAFDVIVKASDPWGRTIEETETFLLLGERAAGELTLLKRPDRKIASVGDTILYAYVLINPGEVPVENLLLIDDYVGEIELPLSTLAAGASITVAAAAEVREADRPGPLVNRATLSGVTPTGDYVSATAEASVEIEPETVGGGGERGLDADVRIVISEIAWAGSPGRPTDEWIELANTGPAAVDLAGWKLCWYETSIVAPPRSEWTTIELQGVVSALTEPTADGPMLSFADAGGGLQSVSYTPWLDAGEGTSAGYFVLERQHDGVISDVPADLVYASTQQASFELPDRGAVLVLFDPSGRIVDSANAQTSVEQGWAAGSPWSGATMERIDLSHGDYASNWQTNAGVLTYGRTSEGRRWLASAGRPNSPPMDELLDVAAASVLSTSLPGSTLRIPGAASADAPLIQMTLGGLAAGGGGAVPPRFSVRRVEGRLELEFDTDIVASGDYYVWISLREGEALLLPLSL
ncbi:lamin tail domain-containing protein [Candidatus Bipolaricaulota bacterium]|nr:lamin tail domain-containing protein [Candidatus Bipolaricaulota bacterium]